MNKLRDYQELYVNKMQSLIDNKDSRDCVVLATGGGKTRIFCEFIKRNPDKRFLIITHKNDLVIQACNQLKENGLKFLPITSFDTMKYLLNTCYDNIDNNTNIYVGCKQSVYNYFINKMPEQIDAILLDECQHSVSSTFQNLLNLFHKSKVYGFTATPERLDNKPLHPTFNNIIQFANESYLIENGYLSPFVVYAPKEVDLSKVKKKMGDYDTKEVYKSVTQQVQFGDVIKEYKRLADHKPALVFCCNIEHCNNTQIEFEKAGYKAKCLHSKLAEWECIRIIEQLRSGEIEIVISCQKLIEGTDVPRAEVCIMLRPTASLVIYMQSLGRVARVSEGKKHSIIIDMVGNTKRHGFFDDYREWSLFEKEKKKKAEISIICKKCNCIFKAKENDYKCPECNTDNTPPRIDFDNATKNDIDVLDDYQLEMYSKNIMIEMDKRKEKMQKILKAIQRAVHHSKNYTVQETWELLYTRLKERIGAPEMKKIYDKYFMYHKKVSKIQIIGDYFPQYLDICIDILKKYI
jgi:superfamily II DNA or RNA helicase